MGLVLSDPTLDRWVYADASWARVASLLPVVKACAREGDTVARKVLDDAVYELSCSLKAVVDRLKLNGNGIMLPPHSICAGTYAAEYGVRNALVKEASGCC